MQNHKLSIIENSVYSCMSPLVGLTFYFILDVGKNKQKPVVVLW